MNETDPNAQVSQEQKDAEAAILAALPKDENGRVKLAELTPEQGMVYYKNKADDSARGFDDYKKGEETRLAEAIEKGKKLAAEHSQPTLTEEEIAKRVPGYADLTDRDKILIKSTMAPVLENVNALGAQVKKLLEANVDAEEAKAFETDFGTLTTKDEYKVLADKKDAIKALAYKPENANTPLDVLMDSYIFRNGLHKEPAAPPKPKEGLETTTPTRTTIPKNGEFTAAEAANLRVNNFALYRELLTKGKLKIVEKK
jgi:hypothetical protein